MPVSWMVDWADGLLVGWSVRQNFPEYIEVTFPTTISEHLYEAKLKLVHYYYILIYINLSKRQKTVNALVS